MRKIASPQDLQARLRTLLAACEGPEHPSRQRLAAELRALAIRVAGAFDGSIIIKDRVKMEAFALGKLGAYWPDIGRGAVRAIRGSGGSVDANNVIWLKGGKITRNNGRQAQILLPTGQTVWFSEYEVNEV